MDELLRKLRYYLRRRQFDAELAEEMAHHRALAGAKRFGNITRLQEESRAAWSWLALESVARDLRYGARQLRRNPGFTAVAILSLALGTGANAAIFQLLNALQLRSLPVQAPDELVEITIAGGNLGFGLNSGWNSLTYPLWEQIRDHQQGMSGVFAWAPRELQVGSDAGQHRVRGAWVSGEAFSTLGITAERGRLLGPADDRPGCAGNAVIGHGFWQREFGADESVVGSPIVVGDRAFTVVGVTPPEFFGVDVGRNVDVVLPFCAFEQWGLQQRDVFWLGAIGRLEPGWTAEGVARHLETVSSSWFDAVSPGNYSAASMETWDGFRLTAAPVSNGVSALRESYRTSLWLLLGIAGLVLLIACANLAHLTLARADARGRELAVRMAIGASRRRVVVQRVWESVLIAGAGTAAGLALAVVLSRGLVQFLSTRQNVVELDLPVDWRVLAFTVAVGLAACVCFGLSTALYSIRARAVAAVNAAGRGVTTDRRRFAFQRLLIAAQVAISLVLVVSSLLFVRTFQNLRTLDAGFRQDGVVFHYVDVGPTGPASRTDRTLPQQVLPTLRALPGVESASTSTHLPLSGQGWTLGVQFPGRELQASSRFTWVSPQFFSTMEIPVLSGRDFTEFDTASGPRVLLVNETFARQFLAGVDSIGARVRSLAEPNYPETLYEIVGVVRDSKYGSLREDVPPVAYAPDAQRPGSRPSAAFVTRSSLPVADVNRSVREAIARAHPAMQVSASVDLRAQTMDRLARERMLAWLSGFFGGVAMLLAAIGLYGVVDYMVAGRRNEIGIRLALGATRGGVVWMIVRQMAMLLAIGVTLGAVMALQLSKAARGLLFDLEPSDPVTLAVAAAVLTAIGAGASLVPASRAARMRPGIALRHE